jgi:hypothetical protein
MAARRSSKRGGIETAGLVLPTERFSGGGG